MQLQIKPNEVNTVRKNIPPLPADTAFVWLPSVVVTALHAHRVDGVLDGDPITNDNHHRFLDLITNHLRQSSGVSACRSSALGLHAVELEFNARQLGKPKTCVCGMRKFNCLDICSIRHLDLLV